MNIYRLIDSLGGGSLKKSRNFKNAATWYRNPVVSRSRFLYGIFLGTRRGGEEKKWAGSHKRRRILGPAKPKSNPRRDQRSEKGRKLSVRLPTAAAAAISRATGVKFFVIWDDQLLAFKGKKKSRFSKIMYSSILVVELNFFNSVPKKCVYKFLEDDLCPGAAWPPGKKGPRPRLRATRGEIPQGASQESSGREKFARDAAAAAAAARSYDRSCFTLYCTWEWSSSKHLEN